MTKITFLGTGTSTGIPEIGCQCEVCNSTNTKDNRLRTSVLIHHKNRRFLIDCGPDFRIQMIKSQYYEIDAVFITHEHYDHTAGLDDLRPYCKNSSLPVYAENRVAELFKQRMPYIFKSNLITGAPNLSLHEIGLEPFYAADVEITPIRVLHGRLPILGYRIGNVALLTDLTEIPKEEYKKLKDLDLLIIASLRKHEHRTHQTYKEALNKISSINPKKSYLIHVSHHLGLHDHIADELPENIFLSYDGLEIEV